MAQMAYTRLGASTRTLRGAEYEVFGKITRKIKETSQGTAFQFSELAAALHENRKFWTMLALDVTLPENQLPDEIRSNIVNLNVFVQTHTGKVLRKQGSAKILIDINVAMMRGLRG